MGKLDKQAEEHAASSPNADSDRLDLARKFLQDDEVRKASTEKKIEFLKEKGLSQSEIQTLLEESHATEGDSVTANPEPETAPSGEPTEEQADQANENESTEKRAPIVTYPEFLAKPARPPPLITPSGFLNTLYGFTTLSALVYGTSQFVVAPMVASTADTRIDLHESALKSLDSLVAKLESTVSEIPPHVSSSSRPAVTATAATHDIDDGTSSCDDPTEVFHRDVGVQTMSQPPSPLPSSTSPRASAQTAPADSASDRQADRIRSLTRSLRGVGRGLEAEGRDYAGIKTMIGGFKDDLDHLTFPPVASYSMYGNSSTRNEPDDEVRRVKENIRSVKGILLSARSFPAATAAR